MFFFSILRLFVRHCSSQFFGVFSRNLLVFFVESLEAVCCRRTLLPVVPVCWLVSSVVSSFLRMPTTRPTFNSLSADLFSTPSTSAPPSSGDSGGVSSVASGTSNSLSNEIAVAVAQAFQQSLPSFVAAFPVRPFPLFPAFYPALFPVLFPARPWLLPARFPPLQVR